MSSTTAGRRFDTFDTPLLQFLGEQNGTPERRLKNAIAALLCNDRGVSAAWLARALYDGRTPGVVLGLAADRDEDAQLVEQIGRIFVSTFATMARASCRQVQ